MPYHAQDKVKNLINALSSFLKDDNLFILAEVLIYVLDNEKIYYKELEEIAKDKAEDVLFTGFEWRMLIPVNPLKPTLSWEDACFLLSEEEYYIMPNIVRAIVKVAAESGKWDIKKGIREFFKDIKEENWSLMPEIVRMLQNEAKDRYINAHQINKVLKVFSLEDKSGYFILILKGSGIISPHIKGIKEVIKEGKGSPLYEINPVILIDVKN